MVVLNNGRKQIYGVVRGGVFNAPETVSIPPDDATTLEMLQHIGAEVLAFNQITEIQLHDDAKRSLAIIAKRGSFGMFIDTFDAAQQNAFADAFVRAAPPTQRSEVSSLRGEVLGPIFITGVISLLGGLIINAAMQIDAGTYHQAERLGKARVISNVVGGVAGALGTTGSILVVGVLGLLCAYWFVHVIRTRHPVRRWKLS